ncbi:protein NRT1/ PTR FAMILY 8.3-like isoform X2 [Phoenix dactylifera]|uniref:Protein NRT1/ PTR FAMILY 8.3-like isoform X2 n=1 Tax=Phoenix dactylifera TaxID=42345 RepID=A0A8B7BZS3_PHODC|nr:protein NRT1/ PTR FAMILY 8.3-like isoform X2 [Phoenix dactylifera]
MEHGDSLERGETRPLLLNKNYSSSNCEDDRSSAVHHGPCLQHKPSIWKAPAIILGLVCLDSAAFNGVGANLVVYLHSILHESSASSAANVATWSGTTYFTSLVGAVIADSVWGNFKTIKISLMIYLLGMITITFCAFSPSLKPPACEGSSCHPASGAQNLAFFSGLYLVAFGSGGIKSTLLPFGADQFNDEKPAEREKKGSFFSWFYLCITLGFFTSVTLIVWIQQNVNWALGFGIATTCIFLALGAFILGTPTYRVRTPSGSPLNSVLQVVVSSFKKVNLEVPQDGSLLYEENKNSHDLAQQRLAHTDGFRFLDKAAVVSDLDLKDGDSRSSWRLCTVTQVEELKILLRLLPIWATGVIYAAACVQLFTTFIQQGSAMNTRIGSFSVPPASLASFEVICVMIWVVLYDKIIVPATRIYFRNGTGLSLLQRLGIGRFLIILTMATAAYVEARRLGSVQTGEPISIMWQLPQFFIQAGSDVFSNITLLEFFYGQAPERMKSMCTALALLSTSLGSYLSSLVVTLVAAITTRGGEPGWISDDVNKGHLDYYFLLWAALCALNFSVYLAFARKYTPKTVIMEH